MNFGKILFPFSIIFTASLNFSVFIGSMGQLQVINLYGLSVTLVASLFVTSLIVWRSGSDDPIQIEILQLAVSLVANVQLFLALLIWVIPVHVNNEDLTSVNTAQITFFSGGALFANIVVVVLLVIQTAKTLRRGA